MPHDDGFGFIASDLGFETVDESLGVNRVSGDSVAILFLMSLVQKAELVLPCLRRLDCQPLVRPGEGGGGEGAAETITNE